MPIVGMIAVMPLFLYWMPVGAIFGRPHFYDDTFMPIDAVAFAYIFGFYFAVSVAVSFIHVCFLTLRKRIFADHSK